MDKLQTIKRNDLVKQANTLLDRIERDIRFIVESVKDKKKEELQQATEKPINEYIN